MDTRASFTFNIKQHRVIEHENFEQYFSHFYTTREIVLHLHYLQKLRFKLNIFILLYKALGLLTDKIIVST